MQLKTKKWQQSISYTIWKKFRITLKNWTGCWQYQETRTTLLLKKVSCTIKVFPAFHNFEYKMSPNLYRKIKIMLISSVILIYYCVVKFPPPFFFHQFSQKLNRKYVGFIKDQFKKSHSTHHFKKMWHTLLLRKIVDPIPKKEPPSHPPPVPNKIITGLLNGVFQEQYGYFKQLFAPEAYFTKMKIWRGILFQKYTASTRFFYCYCFSWFWFPTGCL